VRLLLGFLFLAFSAGAFGLSEGIAKKALPPEALDTIALIKKGGPFPYARDGATFSNREKQLPARSRGWYREYTVKTPGARDRGARRIVAGRDGTLYYTDDHYRSFRRILE
jgi:ribonuclease T1